jgi:peptidoglycan/xylan/chitin deacetylase (PgdA/CDA1 family)
MAGNRDKVINWVSKWSGLLPINLILKLSNQQLILPVYHTISDIELPHIKHLYRVKSTKEFITDLDFLLKHYKALDFFEFQEHIQKNSQPQKPSFLLSFDDGLSEFSDIIAPILIKKGIPAICFLNSGFIDNKDLFYRFKASLLIEEIHKKPSLLDKISPFLNGSENVKQYFLSINYQSKYILDEIAHFIEYDFNDFLIHQKPYLSSEQITNLIKQGFYFGAHSIDHPEFKHIQCQEQIRQTDESVQSICNKFSLQYKIFAFPFTDYSISNQYFNEIKDRNIVDYTFGCAGQKKDSIATNFQRIPFEMGNITGRQILIAELLYYIVKMPLDKNYIHRND